MSVPREIRLITLEINLNINSFLNYIKHLIPGGIDANLAQVKVDAITCVNYDFHFTLCVMRSVTCDCPQLQGNS